MIMVFGRTEGSNPRYIKNDTCSAKRVVGYVTGMLLSPGGKDL